MAQSLQWLDPDRRRRRLQLLAELAEVNAERARFAPHRAVGQIRDLIATRRRIAGWTGETHHPGTRTGR